MPKVKRGSGTELAFIEWWKCSQLTGSDSQAVLQIDKYQLYILIGEWYYIYKFISIKYFWKSQGDPT